MGTCLEVDTNIIIEAKINAMEMGIKVCTQCKFFMLAVVSTEVDAVAHTDHVWKRVSSEAKDCNGIMVTELVNIGMDSRVGANTKTEAETDIDANAGVKISAHEANFNFKVSY